MLVRAHVCKRPRLPCVTAAEPPSTGSLLLGLGRPNRGAIFQALWLEICFWAAGRRRHGAARTEEFALFRRSMRNALLAWGLRWDQSGGAAARAALALVLRAPCTAGGPGGGSGASPLRARPGPLVASLFVVFLVVPAQRIISMLRDGPGPLTAPQGVQLQPEVF